MPARAILVCVVSVVFAASTQASIFFTFADPGAGTEIAHTAGTFAGPGSLTAAGPAKPVTLVVEDDSVGGFGVVTFTAALEFDLTVAPALDPGAPLLFAPAMGAFSLIDLDTGDEIVTGTGEFLLAAFGSAGSLVASSAAAPFSYTEGPALAALLGAGETLAGLSDASFAFSSMAPPTSGVTADGFISSFTSDAAFVGTAGVIPSPGAGALLAVSAALLVRRRRVR